MLKHLAAMAEVPEGCDPNTAGIGSLPPSCSKEQIWFIADQFSPGVLDVFYTPWGAHSTSASAIVKYDNPAAGPCFCQ